MWPLFVLMTLLAPGAVVDPTGTRAPASRLAPVTKEIAYLLNPVDHRVVAIDVAAGAAVASIPVTARPYSVSADVSGERLFVSRYPYAVDVIDTATNTVERTLSGPYTRVVSSPDGAWLYTHAISGDDVRLVRLDATTYGEVASAPVQSELGWMSISPDGTRLYGSDWSPQEGLGVVDTATLTQIDTISGPPGVYDENSLTAVDPTGTRAYQLSYVGAAINAFDLGTATVLWSVGLKAEGYGLALSPDGTRVYAGAGGPGTITAVNTTTGDRVDWSVDGGTGDMAVSADGSKLYVAAGIARGLSIVDTTSGARIAFIPAGEMIDMYPLTMALVDVPQTGADLSVAVTAPASAALGDSYPASVTVRNDGPLTGTAVTLALTLAGPASRLTTKDPACVVSNTTASCALGDLDPGESHTVNLIVEPGGVGTLDLRAEATASGGPEDPEPADNTASHSTVIDNSHGCTRVGTLGDDQIVGTVRADVICALAGDDAISARAGDDIVLAGSGADAVDGGTGADRLTGGSGKDILSGHTGADTLDGQDGAGGDVLSGGTGTDTCVTDPGDLRLSCT